MGSGTVSTRTSPLPCQQSARMGFLRISGWWGNSWTQRHRENERCRWPTVVCGAWPELNSRHRLGCHCGFSIPHHHSSRGRPIGRACLKITPPANCAVEMQHASRILNAPLPPERLELRISVNLGDVIIDGDDIALARFPSVADRAADLSRPSGRTVSPASNRPSLMAGPVVRIRLPPAESPSLAGFLPSVSKSRQLPRRARSLSRR